MSALATSQIASKASQLILHHTKSSIRAMRNSLDPSVRVGFVPTMGALHDGHLSLVREARERNDLVVASIFVNPTQFGPNDDLDKYPRQLERDSDLLENLGVDHLFAPDAGSMYEKSHLTYVDPHGFDDLAEGRARPGHFRGVATVVTKLFNLVRPTNAYFGQKDAAQCVLIQRMVHDLDMDTNVVVKDTIRERDGLAMSSRNAYLTVDERRAAPVVYRSLCAARELFYHQVEQLGAETVTTELLQSVVENTLQTEPLVIEIQYVSVDSKITMQPIDVVHKNHGAIISLACKVGAVRLIDNIVL